MVRCIIGRAECTQCLRPGEKETVMLVVLIAGAVLLSFAIEFAVDGLRDFANLNES